MNILVLNGSPEGEDSITLQTLRYIEKKFHQPLEVFHVGRKIKALKKTSRPRWKPLPKQMFCCFPTRYIPSSHPPTSTVLY